MVASWLLEFVTGGTLTVLVVALANRFQQPTLAGIVGSMPLMDMGTLLFVSTAAMVSQTAYANAMSHVGVVGGMFVIAALGGSRLSLLVGLLVWAGVSAITLML